MKLNKVSIQRAAKSYGVPVSTLKDRVYGIVPVHNAKSGRTQLFSKEQESLLASHLNTMAEIGYGYSRTETINLASDYAVHLGLRDREHPLSLRWLYKFLNRFPELSVKKPRSLEAARARSATRQAITNYFKELNKILVDNNLLKRPEAIYNVDEKGLLTNHKPPKIVTGAVYKAQAVTSGKSQTVTVIGGVNAMGNQVPPFFIFPGKRMLPELLEGASAGATGVVSESGWSNTDIFTQYMKEHLVKYLPEHSATAPVLVLYDGHKSHISLTLIDWAKENHIILFVLPPHCSHLLQPLDISCFGPFEVSWNSTCHNYMRESGGRVISRYDVCRLACKVYSSTLTPANIQAAFKKSGIYPFNQDVVNDSDIAPSLSFPARTVENQSMSSTPESMFSPPEKASSKENSGSSVKFLECRGGNILKNVQTAKIRNTLSKVVGGKAITNEDVAEKIKDHIEKQTTSKKRKFIPPLKVKVPETQNKGQSKLNSSKGKQPKVKSKQPRLELSEDASDEDSETEEEKCSVCGKFFPDKQICDEIKIVQWGQCDKCDLWVHLKFCSPVKVLRRGDSFLCPTCSKS